MLISVFSKFLCSAHDISASHTCTGKLQAHWCVLIEERFWNCFVVSSLTEPWQHEHTFTAEVIIVMGRLLYSTGPPPSSVLFFCRTHFWCCHTTESPSLWDPLYHPPSRYLLSSCMGCPSKKGEILLCCSCRKWPLKWHAPQCWMCVLYSPALSELTAKYLTDWVL